MADEPKRTLKQKAYQGLKEYVAISLYLWLVFSLFVVYRAILQSDERFSLVAHGMALINALALGKILLIAKELHFAENFKDKPLIYPTLFKSVAFAVILGFFKVLEEAGIGWYHGESFSQSISDLGGGTLNGILAMMAILAVLLIPFFAFTELGEVLSRSKLVNLFFSSRHLPEASS
jgi:hypothetical protein